MTPDEFFGALQQMPGPQPVFYRLYHDQQGRPLFYSMEDLPGTYIEIDQQTFAQNKSRVRVINGVLTELTYQTTEKLVPSDTGTMCHDTDVAIVVKKQTEHIGAKKPMKKVDIADLDCIYLSYDEPQKEEFWVKIKNMVPWAKRVDGVKGSDAAHKAAAMASNTERFILIDGDNLPNSAFFNQTLVLPDSDHLRAVFRWRARNHINGLMYGNGGLSSWTRDFVMNMKTHENTDGRTETEVEFCFDPLYWPMYDCYSTTYPNGDPFHAWRAGFREGVKMCLQRGRRPTVEEFKTQVLRNLDNMTIWHNVGTDVEHGEWAIAGSRMGTYMTMLTNWDHRLVQNFDALADLWLTVKDSEPRMLSNRLGPELGTQLDLPMAILESEQSAFFKYHYRSNWHNQGIMVREIDVIRKQEGW